MNVYMFIDMYNVMYMYMYWLGMIIYTVTDEWYFLKRSK